MLRPACGGAPVGGVCRLVVGDSMQSRSRVPEILAASVVAVVAAALMAGGAVAAPTAAKSGDTRAGQEGPGAGRRGGRSGQTHGHPPRRDSVRRELARRGRGQGSRRLHRVPRGLDRLPARRRSDRQGRRGRASPGSTRSTSTRSSRSRTPRPVRTGRSPRPPTRRPRRAPRGSTRTCRPATPARRSSSTRTRRGTAAARRSASSTPASTSTTRRCRHDEHRRAQDRRLGHRDRPGFTDARQRRRPDVGQDGHQVSRSVVRAAGAT